MATKVKKTGDERLFADLNTSLLVFEMLGRPAGVAVTLSERLFKLEDQGYAEPVRDEAGRKGTLAGLPGLGPPLDLTGPAHFLGLPWPFATATVTVADAVSP
jgi:hypothetical protein